MESRQAPVKIAMRRLATPFAFQFGDRNLVVACLVPKANWRPLKAPWWRKKEACIIGARRSPLGHKQ